MTQPEPTDEDRALPRPSADPTLRVARPPIPGRAVRAEVAAGNLARPPIHHDEPTVTIQSQGARPPQRTLEFGTPAPVKVTVGPRPRRQRRYRTWPWIVAVVLALIILGTVLLVMMMGQGETIDGGTDLIGSGPFSTPGTTAWSTA
jgi:hypothetical protein